MSRAISTSYVVRGARPADAAEVVLDPAAAGYNSMQVEFALFFEAAADVPSLCEALASILPIFCTICGRMVRRGSSTVVLCDNTGVPLTHEVRDCASPPFSQPVSDQYFDRIRDWAPAADGEPADAPLRIKVTDFARGVQLIAVSASHAIVDGHSLGVLMCAWAAAFRGLPPPSLSFDTASMPAPPLGASGQAKTAFEEASEKGIPGELSASLPAEWREMWRPPGRPESGPYSDGPMGVFVFHRSAEACTALKARYAAGPAATQAGVPFFSTNDALCGEVAENLGIRQACFAVDMRPGLGMPSYFGVALSTQDVVATEPCALPVAIRRAVPRWRDEAFIRWKVKQGASGAPQALLNSWVRCFDLREMQFEALPAALMVSRHMCMQRVALLALKHLTCYVLVLPQPEGVTTCLMGPAAAIHKFSGASEMEAEGAPDVRGGAATAKPPCAQERKEAEKGWGDGCELQ